jgi:hypothetical protein
MHSSFGTDFALYPPSCLTLLLAQNYHTLSFTLPAASTHGLVYGMTRASSYHVWNVIRVCCTCPVLISSCRSHKLYMLGLCLRCCPSAVSPKFASQYFSYMCPSTPTLARPFSSPKHIHTFPFALVAASTPLLVIEPARPHALTSLPFCFAGRVAWKTANPIFTCSSCGLEHNQSDLHLAGMPRPSPCTQDLGGWCMKWHSRRTPAHPIESA